MQGSGDALPPGGSPTLRTGERVGRYRIERVLGRGGMGVVYAARDEVIGRLVALKLVSPTEGTDGEQIAEAGVRLMREAVAAGALQHANAVAIYDAGEHDGAPFFAMELVEGETLRRKMAEAVPLSTRLAWLGAVAEALGAAHAKGIVHRDIKPENVMVRDDGVIKVLDFGIARRAAAATVAEPDPDSVTVDANLATITAAGVPLGTPLYMAPEQLLGKALDGRSDQFSWGVLAHELLAGAPPWSTTSGVVMVSQILDAQPPPLPDEVPAPVRAAVRRALAKEPADRFPSMGALLTAMGGADQGVHQTAAAAVLPPIARPPVTPPRRRRRAAAIAAVAVAAIAAVAFRAAPRWPLEATPAAITDRPLPRSDKPEALREYRRALVDLRSGSLVSAWSALFRATALDPELAAGWVRLLAHARAPDFSRELLRRWFRAATHLRASLDERDRSLLDAIEPLVLPDVDDGAEWERRTLALAARYPDDAEIAYLTGMMHTARGRFDAARAELGRALRLDPAYAAAALAQAEAAQKGGDEAGLTASLAACFALAPNSVGCLRLQALHESYRGDCAAYEATARRLIAVEPDTSTGYLHLNQALMARGARSASIVDLQRRWADALAPIAAPNIRISLSVVDAWIDGDFDLARRKAREMHALEAGKAAQSSHLSDRYLLAIAAETGDRAAEVEITREVIDQKPSWIPDDTAHYVGFLAPARRLGVLSEDRYRALLAAYIEEARAQLDSPLRNAVWFHAYALPARTRAEAEEALAALPSFSPLPSDVAGIEEPVGDGALGAVYALAGRPDEAIPLLERAGARCSDVLASFAMQQHRVLLGVAREAKGDVRGACAAYARVLDRWSETTARSVTAEEAGKRSRALGCPGR